MAGGRSTGTHRRVSAVRPVVSPSQPSQLLLHPLLAWLCVAIPCIPPLLTVLFCTVICMLTLCAPFLNSKRLVDGCDSWIAPVTAQRGGGSAVQYVPSCLDCLLWLNKLLSCELLGSTCLAHGGGGYIVQFVPNSMSFLVEVRDRLWEAVGVPQEVVLAREVLLSSPTSTTCCVYLSVLQACAVPPACVAVRRHPMYLEVTPFHNDILPINWYAHTLGTFVRARCMARRKSLGIAPTAHWVCVCVGGGLYIMCLFSWIVHFGWVKGRFRVSW